MNTDDTDFFKPQINADGEKTDASVFSEKSAFHPRPSVAFKKTALPQF